MVLRSPMRHLIVVRRLSSPTQTWCDTQTRRHGALLASGRRSPSLGKTIVMRQSQLPRSYIVTLYPPCFLVLHGMPWWDTPGHSPGRFRSGQTCLRIQRTRERVSIFVLRGGEVMRKTCGVRLSSLNQTTPRTTSPLTTARMTPVTPSPSAPRWDEFRRHDGCVMPFDDG